MTGTVAHHSDVLGCSLLPEAGRSIAASWCHSLALAPSHQVRVRDIKGVAAHTSYCLSLTHLCQAGSSSCQEATLVASPSTPPAGTPAPSGLIPVATAAAAAAAVGCCCP
jgi:hypothetical protein